MGAGTDPTKMDNNVSRLSALHRAYVKRTSGRSNVMKNTGLLPANTPPNQPLAKVVKQKMKPAKGPKVSDAGLMNSSSSGSAMGPAYMR